MVDEVCNLISSGKSVARIAKINGMPGITTIFKWINKYDYMAKSYARACEERLLYYSEDIIDIADDASPEEAQKAKLQIDTRKWIMSKLVPNKWGEQKTEAQPVAIQVNVLQKDSAELPSPTKTKAIDVANVAETLKKDIDES
jgi:hypothetical protein